MSAHPGFGISHASRLSDRAIAAFNEARWNLSIGSFLIDYVQLYLAGK